MGDIVNLQAQIRQHVQERDWEQFHNLKDMAISLSLEAAEVLEHFQWKSEAEVKDYVAANKDKLGEELADVLYWIVYMADKANIDLMKTFGVKMDKNKQKYPIEKAKGSHKKYTELADE